MNANQLLAVAGRGGAPPVLATILLAGCDGIQSVLDPRGPAAEAIAGLSWILFAGATAIFLLVVGILAYVLLGRPENRKPLNSNTFIALGGVVLPVSVLSVLLVMSVRIGAQVENRAAEDPLVVEVTGRQWWWEFRYTDPSPQRQVVTANELHIPVGRPVELRLNAADVIHTFWVPNLAGKRDLIPGTTNRLMLEADAPGLFRGQCNEFCGAQHARMGMYVIAQPPREFEQWLAAQRAPAREPETEALRAGQAAFLSGGCANCHTVRGTEAQGKVGPDLTHFASRRTIAAGVLRNIPGNREAWIVSAQQIKPGNRMPEFLLDSETLHALSAYLGSLE